jgi:hypothetical protein
LQSPKYMPAILLTRTKSTADSGIGELLHEKIKHEEVQPGKIARCTTEEDPAKFHARKFGCSEP